MTKIVTKVLMLSIAIVLIGWDIYVAANDIPGDTISELTLSWAFMHPVIPFAVGVLCGHLFWPQGGSSER